jgi:hypothetical protein
MLLYAIDAKPNVNTPVYSIYVEVELLLLFWGHLVEDIDCFYTVTVPLLSQEVSILEEKFYLLFSLKRSSSALYFPRNNIKHGS